MHRSLGWLGVLLLQAGCAVAHPVSLSPSTGSLAPASTASLRTTAVLTVSVEQARQRLQADPALRLVDVRNLDEFAESRIARAELLPLPELEKWAPKLDPRKPLVLICRSGRRSGAAAEALAKRGFASVVSVDGGMLAWEAAGYPVIRP